MKKKHLLLTILSVFLLVIAYILYALSLAVEVYYTIGWIIAVLALLIIGNGFISLLFDKKLPWLKFGSRRLFSHLTFGIVYSLIIINLAYLLFKWALTNEPPTTSQIVVTNAYGLVLFIPAFSVYFSMYFLRHWQKSVLETEKFKKETLKFELDNLKSHLDPHFLFNNLNILSSLIDTSKEESKRFLDKFADVYRSLLKTKDEDLIAIEDELEFIDAYIYLLKTRFEENIIFNIDIDKSVRFMMIPPLTIQLMIENAIKHNVASEKKPLKIDVEAKGKLLKVCNNLNERPKDPGQPEGSGIKNIKRRYSYFTEEQVIINKSNDEFCITVPILEVESI
ncbi:sensor histidine kinase [Fulvivirga lutimaris]|uniref:sensor histidine kinase n=1 Tax=Fulvivirga lutimaris TaxID=1819566 RepID=UPI0012BC8FEE|nr:histidine kinase [Fulvivirga lutimaris]MTI41012.1 histidine kinase [Fulvivirga lutimaris]